MHNRVIPALLCAAAIAFACGPHSHGSAQSVATAGATSRRRARTADATKVPVLKTSLNARVGAGVTFALDVTNAGSKLVELTFPTGQTHDFAVLDAAGQEVWRWSADRMFTQALQNKQIPAGETVTYAAAVRGAELHGSYTVVATLRSTTHPVEQRAAFSVP